VEEFWASRFGTSYTVKNSRRETPWLSSRITICNALIATLRHAPGARRSRGKKQEKTAQRKAERVVAIDGAPEDKKA
jgi:hypothetical protein